MAVYKATSAAKTVVRGATSYIARLGDRPPAGYHRAPLTSEKSGSVPGAIRDVLPYTSAEFTRTRTSAPLSRHG